MQPAQPILLAFLAAALVLAAWGDLRRRIIPNRLNLAIALAAPAWWWASGVALWPGVALQIALAAALLAAFFGLFAWGLMGGGDVKLIAAIGLWLPAWETVRMLALMGVAGGVLTLAVLVWRRLRPAEGAPEVPYGVAIAVAAIAALSERYLYQFPS